MGGARNREGTRVPDRLNLERPSLGSILARQLSR
jgi:hypothetical protein